MCFNPIKAGGSEPMYSVGEEAFGAPPPRKRPQMIVRPITLIVWVLRRVKKCLKNGQKMKKIFFVLNK